MRMGQRVLGSMGDRLRWVETDLTAPGWPTHLGVTQVDAVLSTMALHWLPAEHLIRVYRELGTLVRPRGVVLNGDHLKFEPALPAFQRVADAVKARHQDEAFAQRGNEDWASWWAALRAETTLADLFAERERRFAWRQSEQHRPIYALHEAALRDAGFREVGVIWQRMDNRVLMAIR